MKRAFGLPEMLIALSLLGLLVGLMTLFLNRVFRFSYLSLGESARLQRAEVLYAHLLRDLRGSTSAAVSWHPDLHAVAIQPLETLSPSGRPVYSNHQLLVYQALPERKRVLRKEYLDRSLAAEEPRRLSQAELRATLDHPCAGQEVYDEILELDLGSTLAGDNLSAPLYPRVLLSYQRAYGQPQEVRIELKQEFYLPSCP